MRRFLLRASGWVLVLALGGLVFAWSGLYNVAASSGHWPVTAWLLHFTMRQSVETHSITLTAPDLDDAALIERGAGHYQGGCAPCHGRPGSPGDLAAQQMLPAPPELEGQVQHWTPEQLFWIVKHGLKYTGMPAWPALARDDEVWAVTAFLLRLPELEPAEYRRLADGDVAAGPAEELVRPLGEFVEPVDPAEANLIESCQRCHGADGVGRPSGAFPRLDIQTPEYLFIALRDYASGVRGSGIMQPIATALDEAQASRVADYFARKEADPMVIAPGEADPDVLALGHALAATGAPDRQIAPCATCHGGAAGSPSDPSYPVLAGQYSGYLADQLRLWRAGIRGGSRASIMTPIAANLTDAEINAVAKYYESLPAGEERPTRKTSP